MKKFLSALLIIGVVIVSGCASDQSAQSMSGDKSGYQSSSSSKLGK